VTLDASTCKSNVAPANHRKIPGCRVRRVVLTAPRMLVQVSVSPVRGLVFRRIPRCRMSDGFSPQQ